MKTVKVMVFGLGYIGRMVVDAILSENPFYNRKIECVGAVDIVPESREWAKKQGIPAYQSLKELLKKTKPDVCIHTTASSLRVVVEQLRELIEQKIPIVSSTEELFFPWEQNPKVAQDLEKFCIEHGVALLGTGVNPGFVMDVLPALCTQAVHTVNFIGIKRVVNASTRRPPLQRKIGAGLDEHAFRSLAASKKIGPIGLRESCDYLSQFMGWTLDQVAEKMEPILVKKAFKTKSFSLKRGQVCGFRQQVTGHIDRKKVIHLDLTIALQAADPIDRIEILGNPSLTINIEGGTPGDEAAVAALIRGVPIVMQAKPGIVRRLQRDHFVD